MGTFVVNKFWRVSSRPETELIFYPETPELRHRLVDHGKIWFARYFLELVPENVQTDPG